LKMKSILVLLGLIAFVYCNSINIYGTGLNNDGTKATTISSDLHWTLFSSPYSSSVVPAIVGLEGFEFPDQANSQWIGAGGNLFDGYSIGYYRYRTTFDLTGLDPATASLSGVYSADDSVDILINGISTSGGCGGFCWLGGHSFTITSGFVSGVNTIEFNVFNTGGPTGLQVAISGTATPAFVAPEAFCAAGNPDDWTPYGQGYYCWNENRGFLQCWGEAPNIQAMYLACPEGTHCYCESGVECSDHSTVSPCRSDDSN